MLIRFELSRVSCRCLTLCEPRRAHNTSSESREFVLAPTVSTELRTVTMENRGCSGGNCLGT